MESWRDIDVKETLTTRPTSIGGAVVLLLVILFFIDEALILLLLFILNPYVGVVAIAVLVGYLWYTDRI